MYAYKIAFVTESNDKLWMPGNTLSLPPERTKGIISNLTLNLRFKEMKDIDKQREEDNGSGNNHSDNGNRNQNVVLDGENESPRKYASIAKHVEVTPGVELEIEMEDHSNPYKLDGDNTARCAQNNCSSENVVDISEFDGHETAIKNQIERNFEIPVPKSSIPHWTDEQLDELLAFD